MKMLKCYNLVVLLMLSSITLYAQTAKVYTAVTKPIGNATTSLPKWSSPSTWVDNKVPLSTDNVTIPKGAVVVIDQDITAVHIMVHGTLVVEPSKNIAINVHSLQIMGLNSYFEWGTELLPYTKIGKMTFTKSTSDEITPMTSKESKSIMVMDGGVLEIHGKPKVSWTQLALTALAGSKTLTFKDAVNWNVNDEIVIASSELMKTTVDANGVTSPVDPYIYENEQAKIAAISVDKKTVTLTDVLDFKHWGGAIETFTNINGKSWSLDERSEVGLLTRNILIEGDAGSEVDRHGVNIMVEIGSSAKVSGVELFRVGIGSVMGRYPFHWHMCNDVSGQYFNNNSIHNSYNRAVTIHGSQNARVESNVIYDVMGHAIFLEDGIESGNVIDSNLVMTVNKPVNGTELLFSDRMPNIDSRGAGPAGIWITHPTNTVTNNHVSGAGSGIWYACPIYPSGMSFTTTIKPREAKLTKLDNNTLHSCIVGLTFNFAVKIDETNGTVDNTGMDAAPLTPATLQTITNVKAYKNKRGIWFRGDNKVVFDGFVLANNSGNGSFVPTFKTKFKNGCSIGHSKNSTKIDLLTYGLAYYDGAQDTENCHFVNFDQKNQSILNIFGGANKLIYNTLKGITYENCNLYNPMGTLEAAPFNSFALDLDGSFTDVANSMICLDHPFYVDDVNFKDVKSKNGGLYEWGKQTQNYKFGQIRITREQDQLNNDMLYYDWESPTLKSNGGMHDTGVPASPYGQVSLAVNTNRVYKVRYCDSIPAESKWQLSFSYALNDQAYVILQGSPEKLVAVSGATTVSSIAAVKSTTANNAIYWDAIKNELHVKLVTVNGAALSAASDMLVIATVSGKKVPATDGGLKSRPYNNTFHLLNEVVEAESFDIGGQNVSYYSAVRTNVTEAKKGFPGVNIPIRLLPSTDYLHTTEVRTGEIVRLKNDFKTKSGEIKTVIERIYKGEYWNYSFDFLENGPFELELNLAANPATNKIQVYVDDVLVKDTTLASLGTADFITAVKFPNINITKGKRIVTIKALTSNMTFDSFKIQKRVVTSSDESILNSKISIYPNPSKDGIFNLSKTATWKVYSVLGEQISTGVSNQINLSSIGKGVYLIKINDAVEKVIVE